MTTRIRSYATRVLCHFQGKDGQIALDQIRTVDKTRLTKKLGIINESEQKEVFSVLVDMFSE